MSDVTCDGGCRRVLAAILAVRRRRLGVGRRTRALAGRCRGRVFGPKREFGTVTVVHVLLLLLRLLFVLCVAFVHDARLCGRRYRGQEPDGQLARRTAASHHQLGGFAIVQHGGLPGQPGLLLGIAATHAAPGRPGAHARAGRVRGTRTVVPGTRQVRVLRRLARDYPRTGPPLFGVQQPQRHAAVVMVMVMMVLAPRVRSGRAVVLARRHGRRALVLLLLDLGYLIRVPIAAHVLPAGLGLALQARHESPELDVQPIVHRLFRLDRLVVQQLHVATARRMRIVVPGGPVDQAVGVSRRLSVAEVGAVPATAYAAGHAGLLDRLADHHAVFLKLFRQYGVQERVAARVQRQHEHGEHLGLFQRHQVKAADGRERDECDRGPAQQVSEHQ